MKQSLFTLLLFYLTADNTFGQHNNIYDMIVLNSKTIIESYTNEKQLKTLKIMDNKSREGERLLQFADYKNSLLFEHPLAWAIANDTLLYVIRTYSDNQGMSYTDLLQFNIDSLKIIDSSKYHNYLLSSRRLVAKHIAPLFTYALRVAYRFDTLKGPIYYDLHCNKSELSLYLYVGDNQSLEKWNLGWYTFMMQPAEAREAGYKQRKDQWNIISEYAISLKGPFKVFEQAGKQYIITHDLEAYYLDNTTQAAVPIKAPDINQGDIIVVDKEKDQIRVMNRATYDARAGFKNKKSITKSSERIILKQ